MIKQEFTYRLEEIEKLAKFLVTSLNNNNLLLFKGDLGTGKTTLIKALGKELGVNPNDITSPSFNLLNIYDSPILNKEIYHYDLYRLTKKEEIHNLDLDYALENTLTIIEWPEIIEDILPENKVIVAIEDITTRRVYTVYTKDEL